MALPDGREYARGIADHRVVLLHAKDVHRGDLDDRHQGLKPVALRRLPKVGRNRMGGSRAIAGELRKSQAELAFFIRPVQYDHGNALIGIPKCGDLEVLAGACTKYPGGAGTNESAEVSEVVIRTLENEPVVHRIGNDRRATEIANVVGAAGFIQQHVPVNPTNGPAVQVIDDLVTITLPHVPGTEMRATFLAAFGKDEFLIRPGFVGQLKVLKFLRAVPVKGRPPDIRTGFGIIVGHLDSFDEQIAVMVPYDDLDALQAGLLERRPQVIAYEIPFLLGAIETGVPNLCGRGFILDGHSPDRHAFLLVFVDETDEVIGPHLSIFGLQLSAAIELAIGLHPCGWTPGRDKNLKRFARHFLGFLDHGQERSTVPVDGEMLQLHITVHLRTGIVAKREIATVHVGATQGVAMPLGSVKVRLKELFPVLFPHSRQTHGAGFGKSSPKSLNHLKTFAWINRN